MKNIHILPTDKPSRLSFDFDEDKYLLTDELVLFDNQNLLENRHIYITSGEEIKVDDWCIINSRYISKCVRRSKTYINGSFYTSGCKKIILTTDQDLIEKGVQEIPDEFLEWFFNNSSCEYVEVVDGIYFDDVEWISCYKIIIPKEETKPKTILESLQEYLKNTPKEKVLEDWNEFQHLDNEGITINEFLENQKQETFEEAAKNYGKIRNELDYGQLYCNSVDSFKAGAKWQQEQNKNLYSEKEVRKMFSRYNEVISHRDIEEWQPWIDKQFKKK